MIRASLGQAAAGLPRRLAAKAAVLARTAAENRLHERRADAARWREARLLWPLFTKRSR